MLTIQSMPYLSVTEKWTRPHKNSKITQMRDLHRTTALSKAPRTQYEIGILEVSDVVEFAPQLLALYGQRDGPDQVAQEAKRLRDLIRMQRTKIAVAMPVGELAVAADARATRWGITNIGPIRGPQTIPGPLEEYLRAFVAPDQFDMPGDAGDWQTALLSLGPIDERLPIHALDPNL
ncbi:MAG TPA: hypothetical protein VII55_01805 [Candidatus Saccharimonadales bacterium]